VRRLTGQLLSVSNLWNTIASDLYLCFRDDLIRLIYKEKSCWVSESNNGGSVQCDESYDTAVYTSFDLNCVSITGERHTERY
jgi:hypothetical protein